jgi:uncharacterized protein (DUF885 family)
MKTRLLAAILLGIVGSACGGAGDTSNTSAPRGDEALQTALRTYVVEFLRRNPTTATYLGGSGFDSSLRDVDGTLRDWSAAALEAEDKWLIETSQALERIDPQSLSEAGRIDRDVAIAQIAFMGHQHMARRYQERAVDTYVSEPFRALDWQLQGMAANGKFMGTTDEWNLVVQRVRAIPAYLKRAQEQLEVGVKNNRLADRRMLERDGINTSVANAKYFAETLPGLAAERIDPAGREAILQPLGDAGRQASDAYLAFRDFIAGIKPARGDQFAVGESEYNWALENNFRLDKKAAQLFDESWPIVEDTRRQMVDLAQEVAAQRGWRVPPGDGDGPAAVRAVFDELSKDYPKSDAEMIAWYREAAFRLVEYGRKTGMFDVPADYKLDVVETPPPLQASIDGAAYYPAPPFKATGVGRFYVTPTHNDPEQLKTNNRAALADLAAHEGFPGHDWYYKVLAGARGQVSAVRWLTPGAVEDSSSMWEDSMPAEGWGLYAEALMAEPQPSAPTGFYTPEERLYQLQGKLYRDLRVRIDIGIHTRRMEYDEAVALFSAVVDFLPGSCDAGAKKNPAKRASCESAERAIFRYSKWPTQAITYRLGKDQIYELRAEAAKRLGEKFSPRTFHLLFIRQGTIPVGYFRETLLKSLQQTN